MGKIEDLATDACETTTEITRQKMPTIVGKRRPVEIFIGSEEGGQLMCEGYLAEGKGTKHLIHDIQIFGQKIFHICEFTKGEDGDYALTTRYAAAKQNPDLEIHCEGALSPHVDGFEGIVSARIGETESVQRWEIVFGD